MPIARGGSQHNERIRARGQLEVRRERRHQRAQTVEAANVQGAALEGIEPGRKRFRVDEGVQDPGRGRRTAPRQIADERIGARSMRHHSAIVGGSIALLQFARQQQVQIAARQGRHGLRLVGLRLIVGDHEVAVARISVQVRFELTHAHLMAVPIHRHIAGRRYARREREAAAELAIALERRGRDVDVVVAGSSYLQLRNGVVQRAQHRENEPAEYRTHEHRERRAR